MADGLRQRKMLLTRRRMEQAAVDLAYEEGIASVTVDRICEIAMVSRSTFFNYFPSLDVAIFGEPLEYDPELTGRLLTKHASDLVIAASLIVTESVRGQTDDAVTRRRLALFAREPGTTTAVSWSSDLSRTRLITVIADWLDAHRERARLPEEDSATEARIIVAMSISLGDEAIREMHEVNGDVVIDLASYARARRRLAAVLADPAE
ncbi:MAG TPA: TetR family transcriptional regulator [Microbacteriaceae bacterium]|jgi:AcrR family transcriptional regulator|nr:TetR family transcriptional regulator [Microbacteriaceae bacterium]HPZ34172.1 TetR family transcriptional regulator [Microbacteriaceae bacterium]HQC93561.1 TetR family transcriptional regulator [Microbacteriaceae bacterium]